MKTSRLKNIVIVILLLVNAFLLFLLLSRRAEERDSNERRVEQLCTLFEKNGVAFDRALLPDEETHLSLSLERDAAREEAFASALLGTAESSDSGGGVSRFTGESGSCSIRSGGTADALLSRPVDDPESFCKQFFKTFGYTFLTSQLTDGSGSVTGMRSEKGQLIFNASLTLTFSDSSLTGVSGTFLPALDEGQQIAFNGATCTKKQTEPPARYSQGKLVQEMEKLGLGTKSTRASIIERLYQVKYVQNDPIEPSQLGIAVIDALDKFAPHITHAEMTAELERSMDRIADGEQTKAEVVETITSGRVVPMDTTVAPMSNSGTWKRRAMPVAPSTNQSPPLIRHNRPTINSKTGISMFFLLFDRSLARLRERESLSRAKKKRLLLQGTHTTSL
mgnify:CR=1 FL=1